VKSISKLAAVTVIAVGAVAAVRKFDLLNKGKALAEQGVEKAAAGAEWLTAKADELAEKVLAGLDQATDPATSDDADEATDPAAHQRPKGDGVTPPSFGDIR
jgi:hypothetical protein